MRHSRTGWRFRALWRRCHVKGPGLPALPSAPPPGPAPIAPAPRPAAADAPAPTNGDNPPLQHFGFSESVPSSPETHADLGRGVAADSQRITLAWNWAEPYPDSYALEGFDRTYRASLSRGIRPLITILFSPWWTWSPDVNCDQWHQQCTYPPAPAFDGEWREFATIVARRYPEALGIEIWNEQNLKGFWKPLPDAARYADLLRQAYTAIKAVSPSMPVISGGLANNDPSADGNISYIDYLRGVYQNGGGRYMDGIGIHPYNPGLHSAFLEGTLTNVRQVRDAYDDRSKPLWVTEFGLTTTGSPWPRAWTEQEQATGLLIQYRSMATMPDVEGIFLHTLVEPPGDRNTSQEPGFGVVRGDFTPKPAYCALAVERGGSGCN
jgi:polysaccharide biosynthesis protein PslG